MGISETAGKLSFHNVFNVTSFFPELKTTTAKTNNFNEKRDDDKWNQLL